MGLWIRCQDRTCLLEAKDLFIDKNKNMTTISTYTKRGYSVILGFYDSEERALEVLDEIHNAILTNKILELTVNKIPIDELNTEKASKLFKDIVYEMPKE